MRTILEEDDSYLPLLERLIGISRQILGLLTEGGDGERVPWEPLRALFGERQAIIDRLMEQEKRSQQKILRLRLASGQDGSDAQAAGRWLLRATEVLRGVQEADRAVTDRLERLRAAVSSRRQVTRGLRAWIDQMKAPSRSSPRFCDRVA